MTHDEIIKQLESLLSHCKSMIEKDGGFPIWEKDCEALGTAIAALRPSGEPLTPEQLKGMDGQPVWIVGITQKWLSPCWAIVDRDNCLVRTSINWSPVFFENYGRTWQAYAYPPIDREKWEPCEWCGSVGKKPDNWVCTLEDDDGHTVTNNHIVVCATANYCPSCGRPLTEAAWTELEKRVRSVNHG